MTVYIVDLEKLETRYTKQWASHVPKLITQHGHDVVVISGPDDIPSIPTPGMFLNFSATNVYKAVQVEKISRLFCEGKIKDGDYFLFTDAWHPGVINLKYMIDLLGINAKIGGLWHAGSYDKWDGLGRLVGDKPWVRHAEKSFYHAFDYNYFATQFHIEMFFTNLLNDYPTENPWYEEDLADLREGTLTDKIVRTGWPMEYMKDILVEYKSMPKRDLILFPHRIAPEKQVEIFRDLKEHLPQYEFIVCQDQQLTKNEYHNLLGEAKLVFSANLQETLGISCYEGAIVNAIPMVPDRLSYTEMYYDTFKYPSEWTESFESYVAHRPELCGKIMQYMDNYNKFLPSLNKQTLDLTEQFFSCNNLLKNIK
jgi:glycosyltransferase involved in cell wall biosynthesis